MAQFTIEHLSEDRLLDGWPVVRMAHSHANDEWWLSEAAALIGRGGGILAARAPDGTIPALPLTKSRGRRSSVGSWRSTR